MCRPYLDSGQYLGAGPIEGRYRAQRVGSEMRVVLEAPGPPQPYDEGPGAAETIPWWDQSKGDRRDQ
jgi:hypothetical protein